MPDQERENSSTILSGLREILGDDGLLTDEAARLVYARDASHLTLGRPLAVALPRDESQLRRVVGLCRAAGVPVVCRGSGRLNDLGPVDPIQRRVRAQPGVLNDGVSRHASASGLHFAPDPSSQSAASIGGNIAENAGGPHCLRHGVTLQHLLNLDWSDSDGRALNTGRALPAERGLDLVSLLCGSEGTLGLMTSADLKLVADPAEVATLLAFFPDLEDAARAVVGMLGDGLAPVAVEMVDQAMLLAVEEAFGFGFPTDVAAAMIIEFTGQSEAVTEDCGRASALLERQRAREVRRAADDSERAELWKCRKKAFGAVGRLAPNYVTMDVVVPLGELPGLIREIQVIKAHHGVEIATTFHAGDGNLHPGVHYDERDPDQSRRAHAAADAIIRAALDRDGSVTGEHGVGIEKLHVLPWQLDSETARLQRGIRDLFDPEMILNPGKVHPPEDAGFAALKPIPTEIEFHWENLTVSAPADASLAQLQQTALERGFWIPVGVLAKDEGMGLGRGTTVGNLVAELLTGPTFCSAGTARDYLLELWAETGDEHLFHAGAPVFKNVAGYDLVHMLCGSGRVWAQPRAATFQIRPVPECLGYWRFPLPTGEQLDVTPLNRLAEYLAGRDGSLGGPMMVVDAQSAGSVVVLVPGRNRSWDLDRVGEELTNLLSTPAEHIELPFIRATEILKDKHIPDWALNSINWTVLGRLPDQEPGTGFLPVGMRRLIWQAAPRLIWSPDPETSPPGWHADRFCSGGLVLPPSAPAPGVPLDFLKRMKTLFDPSGALETPEWLEGQDD